MPTETEKKISKPWALFPGKHKRIRKLVEQGRRKSDTQRKVLWKRRTGALKKGLEAFVLQERKEKTSELNQLKRIAVSVSREIKRRLGPLSRAERGDSTTLTLLDWYALLQEKIADLKKDVADGLRELAMMKSSQNEFEEKLGDIKKEHSEHSEHSEKVRELENKIQYIAVHVVQALIKGREPDGGELRSESGSKLKIERYEDHTDVELKRQDVLREFSLSVETQAEIVLRLAAEFQRNHPIPPLFVAGDDAADVAAAARLAMKAVGIIEPVVVELGSLSEPVTQWENNEDFVERVLPYVGLKLSPLPISSAGKKKAEKMERIAELDIKSVKTS